LNKRFRASYTIAIGFALFALLAVYGPRLLNDFVLGREHFAPLAPGVVNIVGVDTSKGYGILVENEIAKMVFAGADAFQVGKMDESSLESSSGERKFVPIKEMLEGLQGNIHGLSFFVERLNDIDDSDQSPNAPVWRIEDIEKALDGDKNLAQKLVSDLNVNLDGTPIDRISPNAFQNGILVDVPVKIAIPSGSERKVVEARVKRSYRPSLMLTVEKRLTGKFYTRQALASEYALAGKEILAGQLPRENVAGQLKSFEAGQNQYVDAPQRILDSITIVLNENQITGARYTTQTSSKGAAYTLIITLNDEGRKRLWQFTRDRVGAQLLLTVNGVAIAAPFVQQGLASGEIEVTRMEDERLVRDAVATINEKRAQTNP